jgi:adenylate cyclase
MPNGRAKHLRRLRSHGESLASKRSGLAQGAVVFAAIGCLFLLDILGGRPFDATRNWLFDTYQRQWPPDRSMSRTVVVEIDEESIRRVGQWPWPRDLLAALLTEVRGAGSVGIDVLMPDPDRLSPEDIIKRNHIEAPALRETLLGLPRPDEALATALRAQPTVLAMTVDDRESIRSTRLISVSPVQQQGDFAEATLPHARGVSEPLPVLAEAARAVGVVSASLGKFDAVEKLPVVTDVGGTVLPSFATELIRIALNAKVVVLKASDGVLSAVSVDGRTFSVDPSGGVRPRFVGSARLTTIKAHQLLERSADRSILQGKVVIIGVTAPGVGETFRNPLGMQEGSAAIQAEMIESVLAGDTLWRPFWAGPAEHVLGLALGVAAGLLLGRVRYRWYISAIAGASLILVGCSVWAFRRHGILLDWVFPISSLVFLCLAASTARIGVEVAARQRHEAELATERVRRAALERARWNYGPRRRHSARASLLPWMPLNSASGTQTCGTVFGTILRGTTRS